MGSQGVLGCGLSARGLTALLLVAMSLRIAWGALVPVLPVSDSHAYDTFARTLLDSGVYGWNKDEPFAFWPPGTSLLYAATYKIFGAHFAGVLGLNLVLSAALIVLGMRIACRQYGTRCAQGTGWILALWPTLIMFTTVLASELPFIVFTAAALDVWSDASLGNPLRGILAGALLGCAALVRPVALALPAVFAAGMLFERRLSGVAVIAQLRVAVPALLAMVCVIAPWTLRNYDHYQEFVLISTNGGVTLWMGNAPGTTGEYMELPAWTGKLRDDERNEALGTLARKYIADDPMGFVTRSLRKLVWLYSHESIGVAWNQAGISRQFGDWTLKPLRMLTHASWALICGAAIWGLAIAGMKNGWRATLLGPIALCIGFYSAVHAVVVSQDRYHLEFAVQMAVLAGIAVARFGRRERAFTVM